jgi:hypothetical protein
MTAITSRMWINPPAVYDVKRPSNHSAIKMIMIVVINILLNLLRIIITIISVLNNRVFFH